jgi:group II intron reverse transcriptase/maturase
MLNSRIREHVQTSLQGIAKRAKESKKYRFLDLYRMINRISLMDAWLDINRGAASGVDKVTAREYEENLVENIMDLEKRLKEKRYKAKLVRRVYIPKSKTKLRPLGIPALEDKLVQLAAAKILMAIFEQDFLTCSWGYRPEIGALDAVKDITKSLMTGKFGYIVDADITGFFDNINHEWMVEMLEQRINDSAFIRLIKKWLKAGILEDNKVIHPLTGTPQGGIVSPVLSNIYLHYVLDLWFTKVIKPKCEGQAYICRYADDFVCAFQYKREAETFYDELGKRLAKFGLELSKEKTRVISFSRFRKEERTSFDFLGFEFRWKVSRKGNDIIGRRTSKKKYKQALSRFTEWIKKSRNKRITWIFERLNMKLRGHYNYYGVIGNIKRMVDYFNGVMRLLFKWLNRRSQRRSFNFKGFRELCKHFKVLRPRIVERPVSAFA